MFSSRRLTATLITPVMLLSMALGGCSAAVEAFGPSPDAELLQLAHQAEADATTLPDEPARALRDKQATDLYSEITRVCGVDPEGQPPASCELEGPNQATGAQSLADAGEAMARFVADHGERLPDGSMDLVVSHVVDTLAASDASLPAALPAELTDETDLRAAHKMLQREYAVKYGLGLASAYADDGLQERVDALDEAASERISFLNEAGVTDDGTAVSAGYEFQGFDAPTTTDGAVDLVDKLEANLVDEWRLTTADANSDSWRYAASYLAAHAQRPSA